MEVDVFQNFMEIQAKLDKIIQLLEEEIEEEKEEENGNQIKERK